MQTEQTKRTDSNTYKLKKKTERETKVNRNEFESIWLNDGHLDKFAHSSFMHMNSSVWIYRSHKVWPHHHHHHQYHRRRQFNGFCRILSRRRKLKVNEMKEIVRIEGCQAVFAYKPIEITMWNLSKQRKVKRKKEKRTIFILLLFILISRVRVFRVP